MLKDKPQSLKCFTIVSLFVQTCSENDSDLLLHHLASGSEDFEEFLNFLGERIVLANWEGYKGGLSTNCKYQVPKCWCLTY